MPPYYLGPYDNIVGVGFPPKDECTNPASLLHFEDMTSLTINSSDGGLTADSKFGNFAFHMGDASDRMLVISSGLDVGFDPFTWDCWFSPYLSNVNPPVSDNFLKMIIGGVSSFLQIQTFRFTNAANPFGTQIVKLLGLFNPPFVTWRYLEHLSDSAYIPSSQDITLVFDRLPVPGQGSPSTGTLYVPSFHGGAGIFGSNNYPIDGEVITITFTGTVTNNPPTPSTTFAISGSTLGNLGSGSTGADFVSTQSNQGYNFVEILATAWTGTFNAGDKIIYTYPAGSVHAWPFPINEYTHFAVTRDSSGMLRFFIGGVLVDEIFYPFTLGSGVNSYHWIEGIRYDVDEARYCVNKNPLWTSDFTPPTSPYTPA